MGPHSIVPYRGMALAPLFSRVLIRAKVMGSPEMIVGSILLAFHLGTGSELHRPQAMVCIGGFAAGILIRMVAMPVLYETARRWKCR